MSRNRLTPLHPLWLLGPLGLIYLLVLGQLVRMGLFLDRGEEARVRRRVLAEAELKPPRAAILDRHGRPLAISEPVWRLVLDAAPAQRRYTRPGNSFTWEETARELAPVAEAAGVPLADLVAVVRDPGRCRSVIAGRLSPAAVSRLRMLLRAAPGSGLRLEHGWNRAWPQGRSLAHVVGFTRLEGAQDPEPVVRGVAGLEARFDERLVGAPGEKRSLRVAAAFGINPALDYRPPEPAPDLRTTLDAGLAARLHGELASIMARFRTDWAAGVVLDPRNGEILAMSGLPDFDPNDPGASVDEQGRLVGAASPLGWVVPPGSTMKPLVVARALADGAIDGDDRFPQEGGRWYARGRRWKPIRNARGVPDRPLDWRETIVYSSNIAAGKIGLALGRRRLRALLDDLHLAEPLPGVPIRQDRGILGTDFHWSERQTKWTVPSVAIGHQIAVTPLRLAAAHASLVNGGRLVEPHVLPGDGAPPKPVWPAAVAAAVRSAMVDMVELESRTWLHGVPFRYGGKSGTVQDERDPTHYTSLFVGFAPAEAPRFLALVVADRPRGSTYYGSKVCGPAVRNLLHFALAAAGEVPPPPPLDPPSFAAIVPAGER